MDEQIIENYCKKCKKKLKTLKSNYCKSCANKGNKNPNWRNGSSVSYCLDCGKDIQQNRKRCRKCYYKFNRVANHPNYKGGKPKCVDCENELATYNSFVKRCRSCWKIRNRGEGNPMFGIKRIGENSPAWIDGRSFLPYSPKFNDQLKEQIRRRDDSICQKCCRMENQELKEFNRKLSIHHIDYNKKNCEKDNLITLCHLCNIKVNTKRNYWTNYFIKFLVMGDIKYIYD